MSDILDYSYTVHCLLFRYSSLSCHILVLLLYSASLYLNCSWTLYLSSKCRVKIYRLPLSSKRSLSSISSRKYWWTWFLRYPVEDPFFVVRIVHLGKVIVPRYREMVNLSCFTFVSALLQIVSAVSESEPKRQPCEDNRR